MENQLLVPNVEHFSSDDDLINCDAQLNFFEDENFEKKVGKHDFGEGSTKFLGDELEKVRELKEPGLWQQDTEIFSGLVEDDLNLSEGQFSHSQCRQCNKEKVQKDIIKSESKKYERVVMDPLPSAWTVEHTCDLKVETYDSDTSDSRSEGKSKKLQFSKFGKTYEKVSFRRIKKRKVSDKRNGNLQKKGEDLQLVVTSDSDVEENLKVIESNRTIGPIEEVYIKMKQSGQQSNDEIVDFIFQSFSKINKNVTDPK